MTPTSEAVTWGSPLYTFRWLLDSGSCGVRWGEGPSEQPPLRRGYSPGPIAAGRAIPREGSCARISQATVSAVRGLLPAPGMSEFTLGLSSQSSTCSLELNKSSSEESREPLRRE